MKKKYIYMLVPLCGVLLFVPFYLNFAKSYDKLQADKRAAEREVRQEKAEAEAKARLQTILDNNANAERRKKEREEHDAKVKAEQEALDAAGAEDQKAFNDKEKYRQQVEELQREIKTEETAIAGLENEKQEALKEAVFLKEYVQQAETNRDNILALLDKLAAAEKARADDAAAKLKAANNS
jgi:hypothetical protein